MTPQEAKKMLKAKLECLKNETSGINYDCNMRLCDGCSLNYEQGNMGEQKEALDMAIKALEQQPCETIHGSTYGGVSWGGTYKPQQSCEDFISRESVRQLVCKNNDKYGYNDRFHEFTEECLQLPSVTPKARWNPVSERLPEEAGVYLVSMNRLGYPRREVDGFACGRWERFGNDVIAWCEIPQPYKAESEGEK